MVSNFIKAAIDNCTLIIPRIKDGINGKKQLFFWILREIYVLYVF